MHKFCLPAALFVLFACSSPTIVWQKDIGGNGNDNLQVLCVTKDGDFIVAGDSDSDSSGDKSIKNHGVIYEDVWLLKFSKDGRLLWQKCFGGLQKELIRSIAPTDDGGCVLGITSTSDISGDKTESSRGSSDMWVVKLDTAGKIEWDKTLGGSGSEFCNSVKQTGDRGYVIAGSSDSHVSGEKTENCRGDFDIWVVKLDRMGKIEWDKTLGGNRYEYCGSLEVADDGGVVVCGNSGSDISAYKKQRKEGFLADCWVVKIDKKGDVQWEKSFGSKGDGMFYGISKTNDEGFLLSAFSNMQKSDDKSESSKGGLDIWLVKIDGSGKKIWDKTIGGKGDDSPALAGGIHSTADGGYILGGHSKSGKSGDKTDTCRGANDYWIVKLNKTGDIEWDKTIGGNNSDELKALVEIERGLYILAGHSDSGVSGDKTDFSKGQDDYWIVCLEE